MKAPKHTQNSICGSRVRRFLTPSVFLIALSCNYAIGAGATNVSAQPARDLVTESVDSNHATRLSNPRSVWFQQSSDVGAIPDDVMLNSLSISLNRTPEREQALQQLLVDLQDPHSAQYHQWVSPTEFGKRFGNSDHDIQAVTTWLSGYGLHVDRIANNRSQIFFSGRAADVANAFATPLHIFSGTSGSRMSNTLDPRIPNALAPVVHSIHGLSAHQHRSNASTVRGTATANSPGRRPMDTYCPSGGTCQYTIFPTDFAKIYDLGAANVSGLTGSGQTIAIIGRSRVYDTDLTSFQSIAGLTFASPTVIVPPKGVDPGSPATTCTTSNPDTCDSPPDAVQDQVEATLDVERAASIAPQANILLIVSADIKSGNGTLLDDGSDVATDYAIDTDPVPAKILSISFGSCEADVGAAGTQEEASIFNTAAAEGISVFVSSGDAGVAGCAGGPNSKPSSANPGVSTNDLCSSGSVTCVGGTEFADSSNPNLYWAASDGANFLSALGYIPEGAWNDPIDSKGNTQFAATGGGVSIYLPTPSWQTGPGVPGTQGRYTPDVSFAASNREPYFSCIAASGGSCVVTNNSFTFIGGGGTSAATPSMAAITALLDQQQGGAQGNLNPRLYTLAETPSDGVFHDVTVASSGVTDCTASIPSLCNNSVPGSTLNNGLAGYVVGTGFDEATGLGSIDVGKLIANWSTTQTGGVNLDQFGITGSWYQQATSGQGFEINVIPDLYGPGEGLFFAGWFTYDVTAAGGRRWYSVSGQVSSTNPLATLQVYDTEGGNFAAPPSVGAHALLGTATFSMSDCSNASFTYQFTDGSGRTGTIPLTRIEPNISCAASGDNGAASSDYLLSGSWYDPAQSGQGFLLDINPTINFFGGAWYTFVQDGEKIDGPQSQDWYTFGNTFINGNSSLTNIPIIEASGGVFNNSTPVTRAEVGTVDITFQSCTSMTWTYTFTSGANAGLSGTIPLTRIGPAPAGCAL